MMDMERVTRVPGPLAAVVMDDKVIVVLIYHNNMMDELQGRLNATTTVAIRQSYPQGYLKKDTLSTIEKKPSGGTELEENSCKHY